MSLELWEDPQMMDQRNVLLPKRWIIRLPADGEIAGQAPCDPCQEGVGLPLCMSGEMAVSFFWMGRVDLLGKELDDFGQLRLSNPLDMKFGRDSPPLYVKLKTSPLDKGLEPEVHWLKSVELARERLTLPDGLTD